MFGRLFGEPREAISMSEDGRPVSLERAKLAMAHLMMWEQVHRDGGRVLIQDKHGNVRVLKSIDCKED